MAREIHYTSTWVDLHNNAVTLRIYAEGTPSSVKTLTMSPQPFTTADNNDTDITTPSRYATGYININNTGDIAGIVGDDMFSRYVTLSISNNLVWQGYIQPQQFGIDPFVPNDDIQVPVVDLLGVLDGALMDYESHEFGIVTFGELICEAIDATKGTINNVIFPNDRSIESDYAAWAKVSISRRNFFEKVDNQDKTTGADKYDRVSYLSMMESIANVLGWVVSIDRDCLVFSSMTNSSYYKCSVSALRSYSSGQSATISITSHTMHTAAVSSLSFMGDDNVATVIDAKKKITIKANSNPIEDTGVTIDIDDEEYVRTDGGGNKLSKRIIFENNKDKLELTGYRFARLALDPSETVSSQQEIGHSSSVDKPSLGDNPPITGWLTMQQCRWDCYTSSELKTKWKYDYKAGIAYEIVLPSYKPDSSSIWTVCKPNSDILLAKVHGQDIPLVKDGCFDVYFIMMDAYNKQISGSVITNSTYKLYGTLKVGNKYWNGSTWKTTRATFNIELESEAVKRTKTLSMLYDDAEHLVAPIDQPLYGNIEFCLYANASFIQQRFPRPSSESDAGTLNRFFIYNMSIKYCNVETSPIRKTQDHGTYLSSNSTNGCLSDFTLELNMATKTPAIKSGYGIMYYNGDQLASEFGGSLESLLLTKLKTIYYAQKQQIELIVDNTNISHYQIGSTLTHGGKTYYIISRDVDWRDQTIRITAQQYN